MRNAVFIGTFTGRNYRRHEPSVSLAQSTFAALGIVLFVCGGLCVMVGLI